MIFSTAIDLLIHTYQLLDKHTQLLSSTLSDCHKQKRGLCEPKRYPLIILPLWEIKLGRNKHMVGVFAYLIEITRLLPGSLPLLCNSCAFGNWATAFLSVVLWKHIRSTHTHPASSCQTAPSPPLSASRKTSCNSMTSFHMKGRYRGRNNQCNYCPENSARLFVKWEQSGFICPFLPLPYITYKWRRSLADPCIFYPSCSIFLLLSYTTAKQQERI